MTKEELEEEAGEWLEKEHCKNVCTCDEIKECKEGVRIRCTSFDYRKELIVNFAEPREKRIAELESQIEKLKLLLNEIYSEYGFSELVKIRNDLPLEIQEVIKEIKEND